MNIHEQVSRWEKLLEQEEDPLKKVRILKIIKKLLHKFEHPIKRTL